MRAYTPKDNVQAKAYYNDRFYIVNINKSDYLKVLEEVKINAKLLLSSLTFIYNSAYSSNNNE